MRPDPVLFGDGNGGASLPEPTLELVKPCFDFLAAGSYEAAVRGATEVLASTADPLLLMLARLCRGVAHVDLRHLDAGLTDLAAVQPGGLGVPAAVQDDLDLMLWQARMVADAALLRTDAARADLAGAAAAVPEQRGALLEQLRLAAAAGASATPTTGGPTSASATTGPAPSSNAPPVSSTPQPSAGSG